MNIMYYTKNWPITLERRFDCRNDISYTILEIDQSHSRENLIVEMTLGEN